MAERTTVFQNTQIGVEVTPGTAVAANRKLGALSIAPAIKSEVSMFRALGNKFPTVGALGKEWVESKLSGQLTYSEIVYILSSLMRTVTPTRNIPSTGLSYNWVFAPALAAADTVTTFTVQQGDAVRAQQSAYSLVSGLKISIDRSEAKLDGTMLGRAISDGITMTAGPTSIALIPVLPTQVSVYLANTYAALTGATALARVMSASWALENRFGVVWALNRANSSFVAHVEIEPKLVCTLKVEADAEGMGPLTHLRAGSTQFLRIEAVGANIETTYDYKMLIDTAVKVGEPSEFQDADGVYALEWTLNGVYDPTWAKSTEIAVTNTVAAL